MRIFKFVSRTIRICGKNDEKIEWFEKSTGEVNSQKLFLCELFECTNDWKLDTVTSHCIAQFSASSVEGIQSLHWSRDDHPGEDDQLMVLRGNIWQTIWQQRRETSVVRAAQDFKLLENETWGWSDESLSTIRTCGCDWCVAAIFCVILVGSLVDRKKLMRAWMEKRGYIRLFRKDNDRRRSLMMCLPVLSKSVWSQGLVFRPCTS
jgi:hypothetical protein